jgi:5-methylcytosine-specific restriction endonuclease McrA
MPDRPPIHRPPGLKPRAQAERERKAIIDRKRPNATDRGYDHPWRALRARFIVAHPFCCKPGCGRPTHDVDHIIDIRKRPDLRLTWSNLQPFCRSHHARKTALSSSFAGPRAHDGVNR